MDFLEPNPERAAGDVIDGEAIIIDLATGVYYSMRGIGGRIWSMVNERRSVGSMLEEIAGTYEVDADEARRDLHAILGQLLDEQLIRRAAAGNDAPFVAPAAKTPYARPQLEAYRDMQELLALDPPAPGMNQIAWSDRQK
jgi:hypothetical protein